MLKPLYHSKYFRNINMKFEWSLKKPKGPSGNSLKKGEKAETSPPMLAPLSSVWNRSDMLLWAVEILKKTAHLI